MRLIAVLTPALISLSVTACGGGGGRKPTFPVTGSVLIDKKPGEYARVIFHPVNPEPGEVVRPQGLVKSDGTFTLTTYAENDGAPAGDYLVTVQQYLAGRPDEGPKNHLPEKLAKPESSGLKAHVDAGPTTLQPFEVSKR